MINIATYTGFTTTTSSVFLPTVWSREVVRATENALVAAGLVKRYDYLVQGRGQTIDIPRVIGDVKLSLILGKSEMITLTKRKQVQRLSERGSKEYAIVRSHVN